MSRFFITFFNRHKQAVWLRLPVLAASLLLLLIVLQSVVYHFGRGLTVEASQFYWPSAEFAVAFVMVTAYRLVVSRYERRSTAELAVSHLGAATFSGVVVGTAMFVTVLAVLWAAGAADHFAYQSMVGVPAQLGAAIAAAVGEELIFRGILFRLVEERAGTSVAVGLSAFLFGLLHVTNPGANWASTVAIMLEAGVLLGLSFTVTRNLWFPIGLHFGWNFTEGGLFSTSVSGFAANGVFSVRLAGSTLLTGGTFGPEASIVSVGVSLLVSAAMVIVIVRHGRWHYFRIRARKG